MMIIIIYCDCNCADDDDDDEDRGDNQHALSLTKRFLLFNSYHLSSFRSLSVLPLCRTNWCCLCANILSRNTP